MKVRGVKATGFSKASSGLRIPEVEMVSGCETLTRREHGVVEFSLKLEAVVGHGAIRLTLTEAEMRDWHKRLSHSLALLDKPEVQS